MSETKWNGSTKYIPIVLQTIVLIASLFIYAMHSEGRISTLEQGQKDLTQQVISLENRMNTYLDRH